MGYPSNPFIRRLPDVQRLFYHHGVRKLSSPRQKNLASKRYVKLVMPARKNMTVNPPLAILKTCSRWRRLVETVGSHLTEHYHIAKTRAHDLWHSRHHLIRKVLSQTICAFFNLQFGRPPLHLDDLEVA